MAAEAKTAEAKISTEAKKSVSEGTNPLHFKHVFTTENPGSIEEHYKIEKKLLGEGSYGTVSKGYRKTDGEKKNERAIKAIDISKITDAKRFEEEVAIQGRLDHPNIVKLYEVFKDARKMYLVMELCTGGLLFDRIVSEAEKNADSGNEGQAFGERGAANYMQQILGAMRYLHSLHFVHRDIKPENFLLQNSTQESPLKVIDFGLAKQFTTGVNMKTKAGTPYYVAPQVLAGAYDEKCDIWSCGVIAYILLCGYPPFFGDRDEDILKAVKKGDFDFPSPDWDNITPAAKDLIKLMLTVDPTKRPSAATMLDHKWLEAQADKPSGTINPNLGAELRKFTGVSKLKKVALTLIAQQLNEETIAELKNTFNILDKNKDGTLTMREIEEGMNTYKVTLPRDLQTTLKALDTDGSGSVDYTEFIAATLSTQQYLKKEVLWSAFRTFDKDGDGKISKGELRSMVGGTDDKEGSSGLEKQIEQMMKECDLDGDGEISWAEFYKMMDPTEGAAVPKMV